MSDNKLKTIGKFLAVLGLDINSVPTVTEFRKAYKNLFSLHPDKPGVEATEKFQEVTEAANKVFEFLAANRDLQPLAVDKKDVLGRLVKSNNLIYNANCVTFDLIQGTVDAWKDEFERMLGSPNHSQRTRITKILVFSIRRIVGVWMVTPICRARPLVPSVSAFGQPPSRSACRVAPTSTSPHLQSQLWLKE